MRLMMTAKVRQLLIFVPLLLFLVFSPAVLGQEPRATPTTVPIAQETPRPTETPIPTATPLPAETAVPPTPTPEPQQSGSDTQQRGSIQGLVYEDVNGDGACVGTGVVGENPVAGVTIRFVSSDEKTVINLTSGPNGAFGLFAAGQSYWAVSAVPGPDWVVTSAATQYAPVYENSLSISGVNFCLQQASAARVLLPASGGAFSTAMVSVLGMVGVLLIAAGLRLQQRQKN